MDPLGTVLQSFTLLTVNADGHALMGRMHKPGEEKRMPVMVAQADYQDWLHATPQSASGWMRAWPAAELQGRAAPRAPVRASNKKAAAKPDGPEPPQNLSLF
jgi:putative SOS response-associated peptidase YedK